MLGGGDENTNNADPTKIIDELKKYMENKSLVSSFEEKINDTFKPQKDKLNNIQSDLSSTTDKTNILNILHKNNNILHGQQQVAKLKVRQQIS